MLAGVYTLATRMLIKLDDQQLGWMAADRARVIAAPQETRCRRRSVPEPRRPGPQSRLALPGHVHRADRRRPAWLARRRSDRAAERGLLLQSAAYTAAWRGDKDGMREMTAEAAAIAARLTGPSLLRDHGGGFTPATVQLHRISAEYSAGEPGAAVRAAPRFPPRAFPPPSAGPATRPISPAPSDDRAGAKTASALCSPPNARPPKKSMPGPPYATWSQGSCVRPDHPRTAGPRRPMRHYLK